MGIAPFSWRIAGWLIGALMAAALGHSIAAIPLQMTDVLEPLLNALGFTSAWEATAAAFSFPAFLRPFRIGQIQILFELADGRYYLAYKAFQIAFVVLLIALFVRALRPRTRTDVLVLGFALCVLTGIHTFRGLVWELYPVNHFLEIAVFCLAVFVIGQSPRAWWTDALTCAIFVVAALTLESGLLVWVVVAAGLLVHLPGFSRQTVVLMTALLCGYLYLRFGYLDLGSPGLDERGTSFWLERLERDQVAARFGGRPYALYAYNVASSILSVLLSEPRAGLWEAALQAKAGDIAPGTIVNITSSTLTTFAIVVFAARRCRDWVARRFTAGDQIVLVALAVLTGNAVMSYGYTKDEILSPGGVFYAMAAAVAIRNLLDWLGAPARRSTVRAIAAIALVITTGGWTVRAIGVHYHMQVMAYYVRGEWAHVYQWLDEMGDPPETDAERALIERLRTDAINRRAASLYFLPTWGERWFR